MDDRLHNLFVIVVETIRRGELKEPERLMGFVRTVLYRQLNMEISDLVRSRQTAEPIQTASELRGSGPDPEEQAAWKEKLALLRNVLHKLSPRDSEVLVRSYIREQVPDRIAREMGMSIAQLYLVKSRAKARLGDLLQRRMARSGLNPR